MSQWYCRIAGAPSGPFSLDELEYLRDRGQLSASDEVREEGTKTWNPAESIPQLFPSAVVRPTMGPVPTMPPQSVATADDARASVAAPVKNGPPVPAPSFAPLSEAERRRKQLMMGAGIGIGTAIIIFLLLMLLLTWGGGGNGFAGGGGQGHGQGGGEGDGIGPGKGTGVGGGSGGGIGNSSGGSGNQAQGNGGGSGDQAPGGPTDDGTTTATGDEGTKSMEDGDDPDEKPQANKFVIQEAKITPGGGASKTKGDGGGGMFGGGGGGGSGSDGKEFFGVKVKGKIALVCDVSGSMATDFPILVRELREKFPKDTPLILVGGCHFAPPSPESPPPQKLVGQMPYMGNEFADDPHTYTCNSTTDAIIFAVEVLKRNTVMFNNDLQDSGSESAITAFEELRKKRNFVLSGRSLNCDAPPRLLEFIKSSKGDFKVDPLTRTKSPAQAWSP